MEIATEMARLVLQMRDSTRNAGVKKRRLELLAERFLEITGHERDCDSTAQLDETSGKPTYTM
jgi:hypothetical protein